MWSFFVVLLQPLFRLITYLLQRLKHKHVQHRFTIAAVESFNESVLHGPSWFDELERYAMLLSPVCQHHRNQLWSIIQSQLEWIAAHSGYPLKRPHHARGG